MTVQNKMIVAIPAGTGSGNHGFPAQLTLRVGTLLSFRNRTTWSSRWGPLGSTVTPMGSRRGPAT